MLNVSVDAFNFVKGRTTAIFRHRLLRDTTLLEYLQDDIVSLSIGRSGL